MWFAWPWRRMIISCRPWLLVNKQITWDDWHDKLVFGDVNFDADNNVEALFVYYPRPQNVNVSSDKWLVRLKFEESIFTSQVEKSWNLLSEQIFHFFVNYFFFGSELIYLRLRYRYDFTNTPIDGNDKLWCCLIFKCVISNLKK